MKVRSIKSRKFLTTITSSMLAGLGWNIWLPRKISRINERKIKIDIETGKERVIEKRKKKK